MDLTGLRAAPCSAGAVIGIGVIGVGYKVASRFAAHRCGAAETMETDATTAAEKPPAVEMVETDNPLAVA